MTDQNYQSYLQQVAQIRQQRRQQERQAELEEIKVSHRDSVQKRDQAAREGRWDDFPDHDRDAESYEAQYRELNPPQPQGLDFPPGQSADISERLLGQWLSDRLGQSFVIDNRPGVAGITIGTEAVVKAPPDGYTLLSVGAAAATSATLYDRLLNSRHRAGCGNQPRTRTTARRAGRHQWHHGYCQSCRPCRSSARLINLQKACGSAT
jgi:Tripartite tricarboxylate transporter family receptor